MREYSLLSHGAKNCLTIEGPDIVLIDGSVIHGRVARFLWKSCVLVVHHITVCLYTKSVIYALAFQEL